MLDGLFAHPAGYSDADQARELIAAYCEVIEFFRSLLAFLTERIAKNSKELTGCQRRERSPIPHPVCQKVTRIPGDKIIYRRNSRRRQNRRIVSMNDAGGLLRGCIGRIFNDYRR